MEFGDSDTVVRAIALAGLVLGTAGYHLLIRRRRRDSDAAEAESLEASRRRARSRFRRLERHDEV